jgi:hypothetical protein
LKGFGLRISRLRYRFLKGLRLWILRLRHRFLKGLGLQRLRLRHRFNRLRVWRLMLKYRLKRLGGYGD